MYKIVESDLGDFQNTATGAATNVVHTTITANDTNGTNSIQSAKSPSTSSSSPSQAPLENFTSPRKNYVSFVFDDHNDDVGASTNADQELFESLLSNISIHDLKCIINMEHQKLMDARASLLQYLDDYERLVKTTKAQEDQISKMEEYVELMSQIETDEVPFATNNSNTPSSPTQTPVSPSSSRKRNRKLNGPFGNLSGLHNSSLKDLRKGIRDSVSLGDNQELDAQLKAMSRSALQRQHVRIGIHQTKEKITKLRSKKENKLEVIADLEDEQIKIENALSEQVELSSILNCENTIKSTEYEFTKMENEILREAHKQLSQEYSNQLNTIERMDAEIRIWKEKTRKTKYEIEEFSQELKKLEEILESLTAKQTSLTQIVEVRNLTLNQFQNCFKIQAILSRNYIPQDAHEIPAEVVILKNPSTKQIFLEIITWNNETNDIIDRSVIPLDEIETVVVKDVSESLKKDYSQLLEILLKNRKCILLGTNEAAIIADYVQDLLIEVDEE